MSQTRLHVRKGDMVMVISGKDKGKTGKVIEARPAVQRVIVDGVNVAKKHKKARGTKPGGIIQLPMPVHVSNVMLVNPATGKPCRVKRRRVENTAGHKTTRVIRYCVQGGVTYDIDE